MSASPLSPQEKTSETQDQPSTSASTAVAASQSARRVPQDPLSLRQTLLRMVGVGIAAAVCTLAAWFVLGRVQWPAYNSSNVLRSLSTAGSALVVIAVAGVIWLWLHPPHNRPLAAWLRWGSQAIAYLAPAALVTSTLTIPLAATRLYLDGVTEDQVFRTQFLTRMTDQLGWEDMAYQDMPSFYPGLWFFSGGAFARITGLEGWAAFQPWALITLAVAGCMLVPVWQRITGSLALGAGLALVTTMIVVREAPAEPYAAIVAMGMPAAFILSRRALEGGAAALAGTIIYLGLSANLYTLFTAISALTVVVMALAVTLEHKSWKPVMRLVIIGVASIAIALLGWGPYLWGMLTRAHGPSLAQHYLPLEGASIPMPFFSNLTLFILAFLAVLWMIVRFRSPGANALFVGLVVSYLWVLLSLVAPVLGTTLLSFRVAVPILMILGVGGILALADVRNAGIARFYPQGWITEHARTVTAIFLVFFAATGVHFASTTTHGVRELTDRAYTDTDGDAYRGDIGPADATQYYAAIDELIFNHTGKRAGTVVLTDEQNFMAFYPYHGYQAITAHYSNPLGEFMRRNSEIESWTKIEDPEELRAAMDAAEKANGWKAPDELVLRGQLEVESPASADNKSADAKNKNQAQTEPGEGTEAPASELPKVTGTGDSTFNYLVADDLFPSTPNVRFRQVEFPASAFAEGWELHQVGPFVVALRTDK